MSTNDFVTLDVNIKYDHSAMHTAYHPYDNEWIHLNKNDELPQITAFNNPFLEGTVLDPKAKCANVPVLSMIEKFTTKFNSMFISETNINGYTYYDTMRDKMMFDSFILKDKDGGHVTYKDIFDEDALKKCKSVVAVIYKRDKGISIADHVHEEDDTFGYPDKFHAVPGGLRDGSNPLSTFFEEAYEELMLGSKGIDFFDGATLKGYQLSGSVLFVFCEVVPTATVHDKEMKIRPGGFRPFTLTVAKNHEEYCQKRKELSKDELKQYKAINTWKVLIPRERGLFDAVSASFEPITFDKETLFGIQGRFGGYCKGSVIYNGLQLILSV